MRSHRVGHDWSDLAGAAVMEWGLWYCTGDRDQDHPHGKEMQQTNKQTKMAVWGGLTNSCEKKRGEKQRRKG